MAIPILTPDEVHEFLHDKIENNYLLDGEEFSKTNIALAIELAVSQYNMIPPLGATDVSNFPSKALLMMGTCWMLFAGAAALLARNTMAYSDGGLTIPVEERAPLYLSLAAMYQESFQSSAKSLKIHLNMEDGWGEVRSDEASFPVW